MKLLDEERRFHGHITRPTIAQRYPPRRILLGGISNEIKGDNVDAYVHVSREKSGGVGACGDGVRGDVGAELGERECGGNKKHTGPICSTPLDHESLEEVHRVPNWFIVDHH